MAFLRRMPLVVRTSECSAAAERLEVEAGDALTHGLGAHARGEEPLAATDAAAVLAIEVAEVPAVDGDLRAAGRHP